MTAWTNESAIRRWSLASEDSLRATARSGDFAKQNLINPPLFRLLGDLGGRRVLDAGCGNGYLSRMLADRGATVVGTEPGRAAYEFAVAREADEPRGIRYVQADLSFLPDLGEPFDAVVTSMVLQVIPQWQAAMQCCVSNLAPGGLFLFTLNHPSFEQLAPVWRAHGEYRTSRYLSEYTIDGPSGADFHRPLSSYLNETVRLGCRLVEIVEPGLDPATDDIPDGCQSYVELPNFVIVAARADG
jgi:SAM-dependent methyltransferase